MLAHPAPSNGRGAARTSAGRGARRARPLLWLPLSLLLGAGSLHCDGDGETTPTGGGGSGGGTTTSEQGGGGTTTTTTPTPTTSGEGGSGGKPPGPVNAQAFLFDLASGLPMPDVTVTYGEEQEITDGFGAFLFFVEPGSPFEFVATPESQLPLHLYGIAGDVDFTMARWLPSEDKIGEIGSQLGFTYDPTKSLVSVLVRGVDAMGDLYDLADVTVDTTAQYEVAFVRDTADPSGYALGNTTINFQQALVYFVNVAPGPVPLVVTPPAGMACVVAPGTSPQGAEELVAHEHAVSSLSINCK